MTAIYATHTDHEGAESLLNHGRHGHRADTFCTADGFPRWKRALDLVCILIVSPLVIPVMTCIAAWIRLVSPGPVFFRQERVGFRGKRFVMLKFRSMKADASPNTHETHFDQLVRSDCPMTKLDAIGDRRVILGGRLLRASGLDELPQLYNVLRREMSLVGPRPCTPREFPSFAANQHERFEAPAGLTGYWQVNGKNKTTFSEMIALDIHYARHMSLALDVLIILKTVPSIIFNALESRFRLSFGGSASPCPKSEPAVGTH